METWRAFAAGLVWQGMLQKSDWKRNKRKGKPNAQIDQKEKRKLNHEKKGTKGIFWGASSSRIMFKNGNFEREEENEWKQPSQLVNKRK